MTENNSPEPTKDQPSTPPSREKNAYWHLLTKYISLARTPSASLFNLNFDFRNLSPSRKAKRNKSLEEQKMLLLKELNESQIDPATFDVMLSNETNRRLKISFGIAFLSLTFLFTSASYAIVILDGILGWGISQVAITALIIETPIQFIGLLYIIARNLFPHAQSPT